MDRRSLFVALSQKLAVEQRLNLEFPALRIPVVWGSARLGNLDLEMRGAQPCGARGSVPPKQEMAACNFPHRAHLAERNSGMREVSAAITRMMCTSGIAMLLRQIAACLEGLVRSADLADRAEINAIEESLVTRLNDASALRTRIADEQQSLTLFEERADALRKSFHDVGEHLHEIVKLASTMLRTLLRDAVRDFADEQADALLHGMPHSKAWHCDVAPLREQLEENYLAAVGRIADELGRVEQFLYPHLKVIVAGLLPDYDRDLLEAPASSAELAPSTAALSRLLAMDLGTGWWKRWLATRRAPVDRANHVRRLIQQEFFELVEELVQEVEQHLKLRVEYTMQRADAIGAGLRMGIDQRRANLAAELALLNWSSDEDSLERFEREQCDRASICVARRAVYTSALNQLENMLAKLDAIRCAA
jgi:hypothetical protein